MQLNAILEAAANKLGISRLNAMQRQVLAAWEQGGDLVLHSPTGSGKTLAFAVPLLQTTQARLQLQAVVLAPGRELALQIHSVVQPLALGAKVTCLCGGHSTADERLSLAVTPDVVIATPGRLLDHAQHGAVDLSTASMLVIDEFDKCLELGFDNEMRQLHSLMTGLKRTMLTSATPMAQLPTYLQLMHPVTLGFSDDQPEGRTTVWRVNDDGNEQFASFRQLLPTLPPGKTLVFVNQRDTAESLFSDLNRHHLPAALYHGALEQTDREKASTLFRNGSVPVLVATDLAARGLDIDHVENVVHVQLPTSAEAYTHRNGRTARNGADGNVLIMTRPGQQLPPWVRIDKIWQIAAHAASPLEAPMRTLHFAAGKKDKLGKGDIVGFIARNSCVEASEIGEIHVGSHYALAAIPASKTSEALQQLQGLKIKGRRTRITLAVPTARPSKNRSQTAR